MSQPVLASFSGNGQPATSLQLLNIPTIGNVLVNKLITTSLTNNFTVSADKLKLNVVNANHYIINNTIYIQFVVPIVTVNFLVILQVGSTYTILNSVNVSNITTVNISTSALLPAGSKLIFGIYQVDTNYVAFSGNITADSAWQQLDFFNAYDIATKVEYIIDRPANVPYPFGLPLGPLTPVQYSNPASPPVPPGTYPWFSNTIPFSIVPPPIPPTLPNGDAYNKYQSIPQGLGFYVGLDFLTLPPNDPQVILFLTNWANRANGIAGVSGGPVINNYKKMIYMVALTTAVVPFYVEKTDSFLNQLVSNFALYNMPVLSSFQASLIEWFLALHVGYDQYPDYVINYFTGFLNIIGIGDPTNPVQNQIEIYGNSVVNQVKAYFQAQITKVIQNEDKTCFTYWWNLAGMPIESMMIEAVHNIFAFSQYNNITYIAIREILQGTPNQLDPPNYIPAGAYNWFGKINAVTSESDKINVVREFMRINSPNPASFSKVVQATPDPSNPVVTARHIHQEIMIENTPGGPANYYTYNTGQYTPQFTANFQDCNAEAKVEAKPVAKPAAVKQQAKPKLAVTDVKPAAAKCPMAAKPAAAKCPMAAKAAAGARCPVTGLTASCPGSVLNNFDPASLFTTSPIDNETILDAANPNMMPVYPQPQYMPFGLGYRRCAAEIFNYMTIIKILEKMSTVTFKFVNPPPTTTMVTVQPFVQVPDNIYAVTNP